MGRNLRKLDIIAVTASKAACDKLHEYLRDIREDVANAWAGDTTVFHKVQLENSLEKNADAAVTLATVLTLANSLRGHTITHLASTGYTGVHVAASAAAITSPEATDQTTANALLIELKTDFNSHLTEAGVHINNDATNTVTAADATDLATSIALANDIKAQYNAHIISTMASGLIAD